MNDDLKRKKRDTSSQKRYMERHTILCVTLDNEADADIIKWLNSQGEKGKSKAVRKVLRQSLNDEFVAVKLMKGV